MNFAATFKVAMLSDKEIEVSRVFNAPRTLVFDAHTKPELIKRWMFGPPGWSFAVCEVDLRVGGAYRFVWRGPENVEMGMGGIHKEIVVPEKIVNTQKFDQDWTGGEAIGTLLLSEQDGKTTLRNRVLYVSKEARDGALASGMTEGMTFTYNRLEEVLPAFATEGA
ncbi:MAG: SRPBCC family protein [Betaproteobacteria bacterium]